MNRIVTKKPPAVFVQGCAAGSRSCGDCGACCKTLAVLFDGGYIKPAGAWCRHWSKAGHCGIYHCRPDGCQNFRCEWLKGMGGDEHRPDRVKVVLDYIKKSGGRGGGILQVWEAAEGGLLASYAKEVTRGAILSGILTLHLYLNGRRRMFIPPCKNSPDVVEGIQREGFEIASLTEL